MKFEDMINNVILGDCYEVIKSIPDKSIDLIVTDPPYEIDTIGSKENNISKTFANCNKQISYISEGIDLKILEEYMRIMKKPNIYIWCNKKQILEYLKFFVEKHKCSFEIMTWCKTNPTPLCGGNYLIDKEFCLYFRKNVKLNTKYETAFTYWIETKNKMDKDKFEHPTIKPVHILNNLILNSSNENDIILDTFVGSGSTLVSAKNLNRRYIGIELNPKWHKVAVDRLNNIQANGQQTLFTM